MKPEGKEYVEPVVVPKVWELINGEHHLIPEKVSAYIRVLEEKCKESKPLSTTVAAEYFSHIATNRLPQIPFEYSSKIFDWFKARCMIVPGQVFIERLPNKPSPYAVCEHPEDCQAPICNCKPKEPNS